MGELTLVQRDIVTDGKARRVFGLADPMAEVNADSWAPLLSEVLSADTIGQQRNAVLKAVVKIGATFGGLQARGIDHPFYSLARADASLKANLALNASGEPRLRSIVAGLGAYAFGEIGFFNMASEKRKRKNQAVAVVDVHGSRYSHNVYRSNEQVLDDTAKEISEGVIKALAWHVEKYKPEFGALAELDKLGLA